MFGLVTKSEVERMILQADIKVWKRIAEQSGDMVKLAKMNEGTVNTLAKIATRLDGLEQLTCAKTPWPSTGTGTKGPKMSEKNDVRFKNDVQSQAENCESGTSATKRVFDSVVNAACDTADLELRIDDALHATGNRIALDEIRRVMDRQPPEESETLAMFFRGKLHAIGKILQSVGK